MIINDNDKCLNFVNKSQLTDNVFDSYKLNPSDPSLSDGTAEGQGAAPAWATFIGGCGRLQTSVYLLSQSEDVNKLALYKFTSYIHVYQKLPTSFKSTWLRE